MHAPVPKLILIADDYDDAAEILADLVRWSTPYDAVAVQDGLQALDAARHRRPDAAILDIDMPEMDGIATAHALRAMFGTAPPLLIACSGRRASDARRSGAFDHVATKPVDIAELLGWLVPL